MFCGLLVGALFPVVRGLLMLHELVRRCLMEMRLGSVYWRKKKALPTGSERGESTGIKNKSVVSSEEGVMGCPDWQHSAWKSCTQNSFLSPVSYIIKMLYIKIIQLQTCLLCALVSALYPRSLLLLLR